MIRSCISKPFIVYSKNNYEENKQQYNNKKKLLNTKLSKFFINCDVTKTKYSKNDCRLLETEINSLYVDIENDKNIDLIDFYKTFGLDIVQFKDDTDDLY